MDVAPQYEAFSYQRRVPEQTLPYRVLAENLETFLDRCQSEEHELPRYVENCRCAGTTAARFEFRLLKGKKFGLPGRGEVDASVHPFENETDF
jgi:Zn-dependent M32 family carboxypeptidase